MLTVIVLPSDFHNGSLKRNAKLEAVDVEQESTYEEVNTDTSDSYDDDNSLPPITTSTAPKGQITKSALPHTSLSSSTATKKPPGSLRPPPPPPPPYNPPGLPKREIFHPTGSSATSCLLEAERDPDLSASCPNLPPKRRTIQRKNLGKAISMGGKGEGATLNSSNEQQVRGLHVTV